MEKQDAIDAAALAMPWEKGELGLMPAAQASLLEDAAEIIEAETPKAKPEPKAEAAEEEEEPEADDVEEEEQQEEEAGQDDGSDEDAEADESKNEDPGPPTYRVKVDGQEIEVPLPELLSGYSRTQAAERRMSAAAAKSKDAEAAIAAAQAQLAERLSFYEKAYVELLPPEPDWAKLETENPTQYAVEYAKHQQRKEKLDAVRAEQAKVAQELADKQAKAYNDYLTEQRKLLTEKIPEWKDESVLNTERQQLRDYIQNEYGYSDEELDGVTDHRLMVLLRKAKLYDDLQTKGIEKIREKVKTAKVLKPGGRVTVDPAKSGKSARKKMEALARRTGNMDDVAALIAADLD